MMNYEIFKDVVKEKFMDYVPEEYKHMQLEAREVDKVNMTMDSINLRSENDRVSPTMYVNHMYNHYLENEDIDAVLRDAAETMINAIKNKPVVGNLDFEKAKDNIIFQLINREQNKEMLKDMPNRDYQDLSIIYRWVIDIAPEGVQSTIIHNSLANQLGLSEEQMFMLAAENTRRIFPPVVKNMNDVIMDMFVKDGMPQEVAEMMIGEMPPENSMWVITNENGINGAVSMVYEDKLHELAEKLDTDLYIMPSSIHEVIAVSTSMGDPNELAMMVNEVNTEQVALDERLSNEVYHYDKDLRKVTLATDTPNKRLDGIVAEQYAEVAEKSR